MATFCVRVAAMVVSEIMDILSPNMAPPMTAPSISSGEIPIALTSPAAMGVKAAIVPQLVPMAREIKHETRKNPHSSKFPGMRFLATRTVASTAPMALAVPAKAPARMKIRHMIMILLSPIPLA